MASSLSSSSQCVARVAESLSRWVAGGGGVERGRGETQGKWVCLVWQAMAGIYPFALFPYLFSAVSVSELVDPLSAS